MDHRHHGGASFEAMAETSELDHDDEEKALVEVKQLDSSPWAGYTETHPGAIALDILQESTTILRKHSGMLLTLAILLAVPVSVLVLSHVLLRLSFMNRMVTSLQVGMKERFGRLTHPALAETVISRVVGVLLLELFSPLLKASVGSVVASTYARKKLRLAEVLKVLLKNSLVLVQTFLWTCAVYLAFASACVGVLEVSLEVGTVSRVVVAMVVVALVMGMALANVTCNLAYVVSVLEGVHGRQALVQSAGLLKGKLEVAFTPFLVTNVSETLLNVFFGLRVLRNSNYAATANDIYWEAPLLVCMHSFVLLFDAIMVSVLYFICKSSSSSSATTPPESRVGSGELLHLPAAAN